MPASCAAKCPEPSGGDAFSWVGIALLACIVGVVLYHKWRFRNVMWISCGHPLMREAQRKAQASLDILRAEHDPVRAPALVKFRLASGNDEPSELVWAELRALGSESFTASIPTTPISQRGAFDDPITLPLAQILDWQVMREDGTIRGGFTSQVEIRLRRQAGKRVPEPLAAMRGRFADC